MNRALATMGSLGRTAFRGEIRPTKVDGGEPLAANVPEMGRSRLEGLGLPLVVRPTIYAI